MNTYIFFAMVFCFHGNIPHSLLFSTITCFKEHEQSIDIRAEPQTMVSSAAQRQIAWLSLSRFIGVCVPFPIEEGTAMCEECYHELHMPNCNSVNLMVCSIYLGFFVFSNIHWYITLFLLIFTWILACFILDLHTQYQ